MTATWFNSPARLSALFASAHSWLGTPFSPNGDTKGAGASCQKLVAAIYREAGCRDVDPPCVSMAHARFSKQSLILPYMAARADFQEVSEPQAGDLLGFAIAGTVHHLAVAVSADEFVHVMQGIGCVISSLTDPTWGRRLTKVWRPRP